MPQISGHNEGWRARVGVILPSINTVVEPWFARAVPDGVSVHAARMFMGPQLSSDNIVEMDRTEGMQAVRQIASCRPASIAYCCTASSIVQGPEYDSHLRAEIETQSGARATTATHSILSALKVLGARRICVVSPYTDKVDAMEHHFFEAAGFEVMGSANLGISDTFRLAEPDAHALTDLARRGWKSEADALVMTCLNTRSHFVVEEIEREIGKPVVTSTQATLWHLLRLAGIREAVPNCGRLLSSFPTECI
jgi:maleate isomerase